MTLSTAPPGQPVHADWDTSGLEKLDVALVHDYLNQRGGAERVLLEMSDMWPSAPVYTSLYRPQSTFPEFRQRDIRTTFLDRLPVDRGFRNLFPLYPAAFASLGEIQADVVIAQSTGWAHMARARPGALQVVYCHTPARWLYRAEHLGAGRGSVRGSLVAAGAPMLRVLDRRAARRAGLYLANSENIRARVRAAYGIDAKVLYPPVDTTRFHPTPRGERLLVVSRLLPYKHVEVAIRVANHMGIGLDVVGDGPQMGELCALAGPSVTLHGAVEDDVVVELMQSCRAVLALAEEDFGLVPVEAQAAGKPVIAFAAGGACETIEPGVSGVLVRSRAPEELAAAVLACDRLDSSPVEMARRADRFSVASFRRALGALLAEHLHLARS